MSTLACPRAAYLSTFCAVNNFFRLHPPKTAKYGFLSRIISIYWTTSHFFIHIVCITLRTFVDNFFLLSTFSHFFALFYLSSFLWYFFRCRQLIHFIFMLSTFCVLFFRFALLPPLSGFFPLRALSFFHFFGSFPHFIPSYPQLIHFLSSKSYNIIMIEK